MSMTGLSMLALIKLGLLCLVLVPYLYLFVRQLRRPGASSIFPRDRALMITLSAAFVVLLFAVTLPISKPVKDVLFTSWVVGQLIAMWMLIRKSRASRSPTNLDGMPPPRDA